MGKGECVLLRSRFRRAGCDSLAPARSGWSQRRTRWWWRQADSDHLRPAAEHRWWSRPDDLQLFTRRRQGGVRALHSRLLLLQEVGGPKATLTPASVWSSAQGECPPRRMNQDNQD